MNSIFIIRGQYIITMNEHDEVLNNSGVVVKDDKIIDIGDFSELLKNIKIILFRYMAILILF